ncbi:tRNA epoxyqueuosine(34) reductase QueG [bacterium]|nr:tRNA epoxyqueuosine(34) reductase QueG [bacterium]
MRIIPETNIKTLAASRGLQISGIVAVDSAQEALSLNRSYLEEFQARGYAGEMQYLARDPSLATELNRYLPGIRSILSCFVPYNSIQEFPSRPGFGRVARYAWGKDYHLCLREKLVTLLGDMQREFPGLSGRVFTDAVPLLERVIAQTSKLGFIGRHTLLIRPGIGSFALLGEILLDREVEIAASTSNLKLPVSAEPGAGCGRCQSCIESCPTTAIQKDGRLDARKCISYLTIEKRSAFLEWESRAIGDWIFGCDVCQEVCPFNHTEQEIMLKELKPEFGTGPYLSLKEVLALESAAEFNAKFKDTPLLRTKRSGLIRNALAVVANTNYLDATDDILKLVSIENDQLICQQARLTLNQLLPSLERSKKQRVEQLLQTLSPETESC